MTASQALDLEFHIGLPETQELTEGEQAIRYLGCIAAGGGSDPDEARLLLAEQGETMVAPPMITANAARQHGGLHAACVMGDSMHPAYSDGDVVMFYPADPAAARVENLIGKDCAISLDDHTILLKRLRRGDKNGTFNLESINPRWGVMTSQQIVKACPVRYVQRKV